VHGKEETSVDAIAATTRQTDPIERETIRKVAWRLLPLLMLGYFSAYLDRTNVGMAAPTMNPALGFSNAVFGFGAGLFFLGYTLAEVPSNLILNRYGARRWLSRILVTWGIISGLNAFVWNEWSFCGVRFLLGLAEAGFFPGVVLYLTWWFPAHYRARMIGIFYSASPIATVIGAPISGLLLQLDGALGLQGWQWMFLIEALPPVIIAVITWQLLTDRPTDAAWLRPEQRTWLADRLAAERAQREAVRKFTLREAFYNPKVLALAMAWFGQNMVTYVLMFFLPLIVKGLGVPTNWIGSVTALPYVFGFMAMISWGWHSDQSSERTWHLVSAWLLLSGGLSACILIGVGHPVVTMIALIFAAIGSQGAGPVFWSIPSAMLTGTAAAGGIGLINAISMLGGWVGPTVFGLIKDATSSDNVALLCMASSPLISAILVILVGHDRQQQRAAPRS
jgi:MFS family permease